MSPAAFVTTPGFSSYHPGKSTEHRIMHKAKTLCTSMLPAGPYAQCLRMYMRMYTCHHTQHARLPNSELDTHEARWSCHSTLEKVCRAETASRNVQNARLNSAPLRHHSKENAASHFCSAESRRAIFWFCPLNELVSPTHFCASVLPALLCPEHLCAEHFSRFCLTTPISPILHRSTKSAKTYTEQKRHFCSAELKQLHNLP